MARYRQRDWANARYIRASRIIAEAIFFFYSSRAGVCRTRTNRGIQLEANLFVVSIFGSVDGHRRSSRPMLGAFGCEDMPMGAQHCA
jgi:hypothetical protein